MNFEFTWQANIVDTLFVSLREKTHFDIDNKRGFSTCIPDQYFISYLFI